MRDSGYRCLSVAGLSSSWHGSCMHSMHACMPALARVSNWNRISLEIGIGIEFHWNVTDLPDTGYNLRAPSALSERLRRFSAHVTSSAALTSLTRSAWPFRPSIPPLVRLPARASPPAHSNTLSSHTWLVVAAFLQRRQPSSPRITARRSRATHSPSPNCPPTNSYPPGPASPRRAAYAVPPRKSAVWEGPGQSPVGGAGLPR